MAKRDLTFDVIVLAAMGALLLVGTMQAWQGEQARAAVQSPDAAEAVAVQTEPEGRVEVSAER